MLFYTTKLAKRQRRAESMNVNVLMAGRVSTRKNVAHLCEIHMNMGSHDIFMT